MAIKFYSDKTQKYYDTVEAANRAEFEVKEACEGSYNKESGQTSYGFASVCHFVIFVFTKIAKN